MTAELADTQIQIKLVTRQQSHAVPDVPLSVPTNIDTKNLNKLVNVLLKENLSEFLKPIEFDFVVTGELLRVPLLEYLQEKNVSTEATIEVEYVERTPAPQPEDTLLHDDWVAGIEVAEKWIITGCYDNTVNVWSTNGKHAAIGNNHANCVRAVTWLRHGDPTSGFVSCSHDLSAILWHWEPGMAECQPKIILKGHERGIDTVSVSGNGHRLVTGGWDTHLKIWSASLEQEDDEPPNKKSKGLTVRTPLHTLKGHKETISGSVWLDQGSAATCSMDHTIKIWDVELCGMKTEMVGQKAFLSVSWSPLTNTLLATSADRHIRMFDPRSSEGTVCKATYTSHTMWVSAVCWSSYNEHLFMSGGYDQCVKLWDTRCPRAPLFDLQGHQGKVLCVDWTSERHLVSGGSDNSVNIFRNTHQQHIKAVL